MNAQEILRRMTARHVTSFLYNGIWAGYSPSDGLYWVGGNNFQKPEEAASEMIKISEKWREIDECIDD